MMITFGEALKVLVLVAAGFSIGLGVALMILFAALGKDKMISREDEIK